MKSSPLLFALGLLAMSSTASAAERTPVSAIPILVQPKDAGERPKHTGVPGMTITEKAYAYAPGKMRIEIDAATKAGYCFVNRENNLQLNASSSADSTVPDLVRFTEAEGKATLERLHFATASGPVAWVTSRARIELRQVGSASGVTVWSYREANGELVLLAHGASSGREATPVKNPDEDGGRRDVWSDCSFGATRVSAAQFKSGAIVQLFGALPPVGEGKDKIKRNFIVDGSVAKVTRDPEPILAVRVRVVEGSG